ncbi:EAL domain-containing protein, partial [Scandinavium sp. V105_16]
MMKINIKKPYPFSFLVVLSSILIVISILVVTALSALVNGEVKTVLGDMSERVLTSKSDLIVHRVEMYMNQPVQTNQFLASQLKEIEPNSHTHVRQALLQFFENGIAGGQPIPRIAYTSASGNYLAFSRSKPGEPFLIHTGPRGSKQLVVYNGMTEASGIARIIKNYDPFTRPWFIQAHQTNQPFWTTNYKHISESSGQVMSYRTPVIGKNGQFIGVITSDIHPEMMRNYLQTLKPFPGSTVLILDDQGNIVTTTHDHHQKRLSKIVSDSSWGHPVALPSLKVLHPNLANLLADTGRFQGNRSGPVSVEIDGGQFYLLSRPLSVQSGLNNWRLVIITPTNTPVALLKHYQTVTILIMSGVILLSLLLIIGLLVWFNRPLKVILRKAALLGKQPFEMENHVRLFPEVARLDKELARTSEMITESLTAQHKLAEEDPETGLPNYAGLCKQITDDDERNLVVLIHLTNYAVLNMTLGREYAAELVSTGIAYLKRHLPEGSLLARIRTDKFVIIFPDRLESSQIDVCQQWLSDLFLDPLSVDGGEDHLFQGNAGVVVEPVTRERIMAILLNASIAAHNAAGKGNGGVVRFSAEMHEEAVQNLRLYEHLRQAVNNEEFHLVLQPIVDLATPGLCSEGECLIRWHSKVLGFVPPDKFIALAESTGLILQIGRWVIETACRELSDFIQRGAPEDFKLHINISGMQLKHPGFSSHLHDCIKRHHLRPENICVELTESILVNDSDSGRVIHLLTELRRHNITVALDDFGSGYSSLSYLHHLPFDCLKIDRNFVKDVLDSKKSEAMILSILGIAKNFHVPLVAEGIETAEMGDKLHELGCEKAQGYFYGRP